MKVGVGKILVFLALTFGFSYCFYWLLIAEGTMDAGGGIYVLGLMWCPGVAAILTQILFHRSLRGMGWGWGSWKKQGWSYFIPLGYAAVAYAVVWAVGLGGFPNEEHLAAVAEQIGVTGYSNELLSLISFLNVAIAGFAIGLFWATGEEIGWRGLLVPELAKVTSFTRTALISGGVWAAWHYPGILFLDYNSAGLPTWYALVCFTIMVLSISFIYAYMRLTSGSLWTGAMLHASHNSFIQSFFTPITVDTGSTAYYIDEFGMMVPIVTVVVAVLVRKKQKKEERTLARETSS